MWDPMVSNGATTSHSSKNDFDSTASSVVAVIRQLMLAFKSIVHQLDFRCKQFRNDVHCFFRIIILISAANGPHVGLCFRKIQWLGSSNFRRNSTQFRRQICIVKHLVHDEPVLVVQIYLMVTVLCYLMFAPEHLFKRARILHIMFAPVICWDHTIPWISRYAEFKVTVPYIAPNPVPHADST